MGVVVFDQRRQLGQFGKQQASGEEVDAENDDQQRTHKQQVYAKREKFG